MFVFTHQSFVKRLHRRRFVNRSRPSKRRQPEDSKSRDPHRPPAAITSHRRHFGSSGGGGGDANGSLVAGRGELAVSAKAATRVECNQGSLPSGFAAVRDGSRRSQQSSKTASFIRVVYNPNNDFPREV